MTITKETEQHILNASFDEQFQVLLVEPVKRNGDNTAIESFNPATEEKQDALLANYATNNVLIATMNELVKTQNELIARLDVLGGMANSGAPALRIIPIGSTAVTGTLTSVGTLTNFGTGIPASEIAHDINNSTAILANIVNVVVT